MLPISGAFGLSAEGYVGGIGSASGAEAAAGGWDGGARLFATSRLLFLNVGVDWNARTQKADFVLAFTPYLRRGGLFRTGGNFRLEWIPGRNHSFNVGFQVPLEPHMGETRPIQRDARLPRSPSGARPAPSLPDETRARLRELRDSAQWLFLHANFFNDDDDSSFAAGRRRTRRPAPERHAAQRDRASVHRA